MRIRLGKCLVVIVICLTMIGTNIYGVDQQKIVENEEGLVLSAEELLTMYIDNSMSVKQYELDKIINRYTLLNGELDLKRVEEGIIDLEKNICNPISNTRIKGKKVLPTTLDD